jgi:hypothetical protein
MVSEIRLGLVAFCSPTGLGYQTRAIHQHLKPAKTMVVDLSSYNGMPLHPDWYPDAWRFVRGFPTDQDCDEFLDGLDSVIVCETPLNYRLFAAAEKRGVRTILQANPEFCDYLTSSPPPRPTLIGLPSTWMEDEIRHAVPGIPVEALPVPIDLSALPQRAITEARRFIHIAGRPAAHDRNGTLDFIAAARIAARSMPGAEFIIFCQTPTDEISRALLGAPITLVGAVSDPTEMYREADILVLPRRYGGLCLPAQEAVGSGIPVLMPAISPNNSWLPHSWLLPVRPDHQRFMARSPINLYGVEVPVLAQRMIALYRDRARVVRMHHEAQTLARRLSWDALLSRYEEVIGLQELAA